MGPSGTVPGDGVRLVGGFSSQDFSEFQGRGGYDPGAALLPNEFQTAGLRGGSNDLPTRYRNVQPFNRGQNGKTRPLHSWK